MIWRQTAAILLDSYRELNAKKLFWVTLGLSLLIVVVFAMIGVNDSGIHFLWFTIPGSAEFAQRISPAAFYKYWMYVVGIGLWLTWAATILALISTCTIFPDLVQSGSIDLMLSKPISRVRLFLTKYACGLLFVALQVAVFSLGSFLVVGLRGGSWEFGIFLAIPIVVAFFSYLFSVCALLGIVTRSTVASLLLTLLLWLGLWALNTTEAGFLNYKVGQEYNRDFYAQRLDYWQPKVDALRAELDQQKADGKPISDRDQSRLDYGQKQIDEAKSEIASAEKSLPGVTKWAGRITLARTVLPKTNETIELLNRYLLDFKEIEAFIPKDGRSVVSDEDLEQSGASPSGTNGAKGNGSEPVASEAARLNKIYRSRSLWWVLGTSLAFEAVMICIAGVVFTRRDF